MSMFRNPFDPVFVLAAVAGVTALRRAWPATRRPWKTHGIQL